MSRQKLPNGDDYPDAATKNLDDARTPLAGGRADGAAYLCGYVLECAFKTLIVFGESGGKPPWSAARARGGGHRLRELSGSAARLSALLTSSASRYPPDMDESHPVYGTWSETMRYREAGAISAAVASSWLEEAEKVWRSVVSKMALAGDL